MKENTLRMKMPESQGVPLLSNLESQFRFIIQHNRVCIRVHICVGEMERLGCVSENVCESQRER